MTSAIDPNGTIRIGDLAVPASDFASDAARRELARLRKLKPLYVEAAASGDVATLRRLLDEHEAKPALARARALFPVEVEAATFGGVPADVVTPAGGVALENEGRVLVNLHGGGFFAGAGARALLEAVPIAAVGRIKVVTLDYRLAPEHLFPAASEDIAAAYQALLKDHRPEAVGLYGCSAGATLSAEAVAWFQSHGLPRPGAIAMVCGNAARMGQGDSAGLGRELGVVSSTPSNMRWYFDGSDPRDPLVSPCASPAVMAQFPPTLLVSASRDFFLSHSAYMHLQLVKAGVPAELCVWDGLWHGFVWSPELPESRDAYGIIARFFARHLA